MTRPTRETRAGRVYLDLQNMARRNRRPTDELLALYALEGFLDRLSRSSDADRFVLKGGTLLAYEVRRPTRDVDLHAFATANEPDRVLSRIRDIAREPYLWRLPSKACRNLARRGGVPGSANRNQTGVFPLNWAPS